MLPKHAHTTPRPKPLLPKMLAGLALMLGLTACTPEPDFPDPGPGLDAYRGIFVLNEGQWTQNNATLDFYDPQANLARTAGVFAIETGQPLGDVAHSATLTGDTLVLVINNARRLHQILLPQFQLLATLDLGTQAAVADTEAISPRTYLPVGPNKAYVNSLLNGTIYIVERNGLRLTSRTIAVENYPEDMALAAGRVFVSLGSYTQGLVNNRLAVINPETDALERTLTLPVENPGRLLPLPSGQLAVLCRGNYSTIPGAVVILNPQTLAIDTTIPLQGSVYDAAVAGPNLGDLLLLTDPGLGRLDLQTWALDEAWLTPDQLGSHPQALLYSLYWDVPSQRLYLGNAGLGAVNGQLHTLAYGPNGTLTEPLPAQPTGLFPGAIFRYPAP